MPIKIAIKIKAPLIRINPRGKVKLEEDLEVRYMDFRFTVPRGFECDSSSVPRVAWRVTGAPTTGPNLVGGLAHDYLYRTGIFDRKTSDKIFYEILKHLGKPNWIAWIMYAAVRCAGWQFYKKK